MKIFVFLVLLSGQIIALNLHFKNFSSEFTQDIFANNTKITYEGNFVLTQSKAFWNYTKPNSKQIYIKNKEVVIVEPDLEQVIFTKIDNVPNLGEIFKKAKKNSQGFYEAKYENTLYTIRLKNDEVQNISYKDDLDNEVSINLYKQSYDTNINEDIFNAKFPKHYDIIK